MFKSVDSVLSVLHCSLMRQKKSPTERKRRSEKVVALAAEPNVAVAPVASSGFSSSVFGGPPPEALFLEAESEPDHRTLAQYTDSIRLLRDKSFSYREIANWLSERGVAANHNGVYRVYTKSLSDYDAALEAEREADEEREEALRNG